MLETFRKIRHPKSPKPLAMPSEERSKSSTSLLSHKRREENLQQSRPPHAEPQFHQNHQRRRSGSQQSQSKRRAETRRRSTSTSLFQDTSRARPRTTQHSLDRTLLRCLQVHGPPLVAPWLPSTTLVVYLLAVPTDSRWLLLLPQLIPKAAWHSPRAGNSPFPRNQRHLLHRSAVQAPRYCLQHSTRRLGKSHPRATRGRTLFLALARNFLDVLGQSWVAVALRPTPLVQSWTSVILQSA